MERPKGGRAKSWRQGFESLSLALSCGLIVACSNPSDLLPDSEPFLVGVITTIEDTQLVVHAGVDDECGTILLGLDEATLLKRTASGHVLEIASTELVVGAPVQVWITGAHFDSCPAITRLDVLEVLPSS